MGWCISPQPLPLAVPCPLCAQGGDARSPRCGSARAGPASAVLAVLAVSMELLAKLQTAEEGSGWEEDAAMQAVAPGLGTASPVAGDNLTCGWQCPLMARLGWLLSPRPGLGTPLHGCALGVLCWVGCSPSSLSAVPLWAHLGFF